jgi:hypothetical protein
MLRPFLRNSLQIRFLSRQDLPGDFSEILGDQPHQRRGQSLRFSTTKREDSHAHGSSLLSSIRQQKLSEVSNIFLPSSECIHFAI